MKVAGDHRGEDHQHPGRKANSFNAEAGFVKNTAAL
jgi:hypothetical protein